MREQEIEALSGAGPSTSRRSFLGATAAAGVTTLAGTQGSALAAHPPARREPRLRERLPCDFEPVLVDAGPVSLYARAIGSGELVVMHPSLARGGADFDAVARLIAARGYQVVSFDPRGILSSTVPQGTLANLTLHDYADDLVAVVRRFGAQAHLVGHAFGNRVARVAAADHPEIVRSVTLYAAGGGIPPPEALAGLATILNPQTPDEEHRDAVRRTFFAPGNDPTLWFAGWSRGPEAQAESVAGASAREDEFRNAGGRPMLVVQGLDDIVAPPERGRGLKAEFPEQVTLVELERAGHALVFERPRAVAGATLRFLGRMRRRRGLGDPPDPHAED